MAKSHSDDDDDDATADDGRTMQQQMDDAHAAAFRPRKAPTSQRSTITLSFKPGSFQTPTQPRAPFAPPFVRHIVPRPQLLLERPAVTDTDSQPKKKRRPDDDDDDDDASTVAGKAESDGKKKKVPHPLPPALESFTFADRARLTLQEETDPKNKADPGPYKVAKFLSTGSVETSDGKKWDLDQLHSEQLRSLAQNFGCTHLGSAGKFKCRMAMARRVEMGVVYNNQKIQNVTTMASEKYCNTLMRLINACFLPDNVGRPSELNDHLKRKDFVANSTARNPLTTYWIEIADTVNDADLNDTLAVLLDSGEDEDPHLHEMVLNQTVNLCDFNQGTSSSFELNMKHLMKARSNCLNAQTTSGTHEDDFWNFLQPKFLKVKNKLVPGGAVYYHHVMCLKYPSIDAAYVSILSNDLKSNSLETPTDEEKKSPAVKDQFLSAFQEQGQQLQQIAKEAASRTSELIGLQKEQATSAKWSQYEQLVTKLEKHSGLSGNARLVFNLARRVKSLELELDIPEIDSAIDLNEYRIEQDDDDD